MDPPEEYVEIEVKPRGYHRFGIKKKVEAARAQSSIILGKDPTGVYPIFIQGAAGNATKIPVNNSLGRGCRVRATGRKPNVVLRAIPFVAYYRPGTLDAVKRHLNGEPTGIDFTGVNWEVEAQKRQKNWKEGGTWSPPDQFASYKYPLPGIDLNAITWGLEEPFASIPAFAKYELTSGFQNLVRQLRSKITRDYISEKQLTVYVLWWCHYKNRDLSEYQGFMGADMPCDPVPLVIFAILMPTILREAEDDGLVAYPDFMLAAATRAAVEFPTDGAESEILESETQTIQDQLLAEFEEPEIAATLLPGDLYGTKNERFSNNQLIKSEWASWDSPGIPHYKAVRPTVEMLGDINTIFRPHPGSNTKLKFRTLIPQAESQAEYEVLRNYKTLPDLKRLCQANLKKDIYIHPALPTSSATRVDKSSLANKPCSVIVDMEEQAMEEGNIAALRRVKTTSQRPLKIEALLPVKREHWQNSEIPTHDRLTDISRDGNIGSQQKLKRQCHPGYISNLSPPARECSGYASRSDSGIGTKKSDHAVPRARFTSLHDMSQVEQKQYSREHIHFHQVPSEALRQGWAHPSQIRDAARRQGLVDPSDERDQGKLAHWGYEKTMLRATPMPLSFQAVVHSPQHLMEDISFSGHEICTTLRNDPANGVLSAIRITLSSFSPLTSKLQATLIYVENEPVTASDFLALQHYEDALDELLLLCSRMALISRTLAETKDRHREDKQRAIPRPLTSRLADLLWNNFEDKLPQAFYEQVASCRWDHEDGQQLVGEILRWSRDLHKFWYASAVVVERCCAAVDRGCHQHFLPQSRARLWRDWVAPWKIMDGPWRLQRRHEESTQNQQGEASISSPVSTPFEPGTRFSMPTLGRELQYELIATAIADLSGNQDIANWLYLPCDSGRTVEPLAVKATDRDGLYLHKNGTWYK